MWKRWYGRNRNKTRNTAPSCLGKVSELAVEAVLREVFVAKHEMRVGFSIRYMTLAIV